MLVGLSPSLECWQLLEKKKLTKPRGPSLGVSFPSGRSGVLFWSFSQPWASAPFPSVTVAVMVLS